MDILRLRLLVNNVMQILVTFLRVYEKFLGGVIGKRNRTPAHLIILIVAWAIFGLTAARIVGTYLRSLPIAAVASSAVFAPRIVQLELEQFYGRRCLGCGVLLHNILLVNHEFIFQILLHPVAWLRVRRQVRETGAATGLTRVVI